jgi:hypothetical protein
VSLFLNRYGVNTKYKDWLKVASQVLLILAEQLFTVFPEADEDHHSRSSKADKKHPRQYPHCEDGYVHETDCSLFSISGPTQNPLHLEKRYCSAL